MPERRNPAELGRADRPAPIVSRRYIMQSAGVLGVAGILGRGAPAYAERIGGLLDPARIAGYALPELRSAQIADVPGGRMTYAIQGSPRAPVVVYFHGWGDDYRVVLPLEYPLVDAGFRLLVAHRPGYAGTSLQWKSAGKAYAWLTAADTARATAHLLGQLHGGSRWQVAVMGMSGGAPAALAFASLYPRETMALIVQSGVTHPWTDAKFVPELLRDNYITAFKSFGWAGDQISQVMFGLLAKLRENFMNDEDKLRALAGERLGDAKMDPAFAAVASRILVENKANTRGELNDARSIFFAKAPYCRWDSIRAPTLIVHDMRDPFVPFVHAEEAHKRIAGASLRTFHLGGHMPWIGRDALEMHHARVEFLQSRKWKAP